jgi:hypothetical protein
VIVFGGGSRGVFIDEFSWVRSKIFEWKSDIFLGCLKRVRVQEEIPSKVDDEYGLHLSDKRKDKESKGRNWSNVGSWRSLGWLDRAASRAITRSSGLAGSLSWPDRSVIFFLFFFSSLVSFV